MRTGKRFSLVLAGLVASVLVWGGATRAQEVIKIGASAAKTGPLAGGYGRHSLAQYYTLEAQAGGKGRDQGRKQDGSCRAD
jgi:hypothetical protein